MTTLPSDSSSVERVAVIGAGTMGLGIAYVSAVAGLHTWTVEASSARRAEFSAEFERVYRESRSHGNRYLVLYAFPREDDGGVRLSVHEFDAGELEPCGSFSGRGEIGLIDKGPKMNASIFDAGSFAFFLGHAVENANAAAPVSQSFAAAAAFDGNFCLASRRLP